VGEALSVYQIPVEAVFTKQREKRRCTVGALEAFLNQFIKGESYRDKGTVKIQVFE
jgi:hypothetical protein